MQFRNPVFNAFGTIDCEVLHSTLGWIPFTASPSDVQENGRRIFADALSRARPYVPPPPVTPEEIRLAMPPLSFAQLLIGLVAEDWITEAEGEAWLSGTLPSAVVGVIASLPAAARFAARAKAARPSQVVRTDPLVVALGVAAVKSPDQLDTFFETYRSV